MYNGSEYLAEMLSEMTGMSVEKILESAEGYFETMVERGEAKEIETPFGTMRVITNSLLKEDEWFLVNEQ